MLLSISIWSVLLIAPWFVAQWVLHEMQANDSVGVKEMQFGFIWAMPICLVFDLIFGVIKFVGLAKGWWTQ